jgi:hypothetical protein
MAAEEPIFLRNAVEANLLQALLEQEGIPHYVKPYRDPGRDGVWTFNTAWGQVECAAEHRERVKQLLEGLRQREQEGNP